MLNEINDRLLSYLNGDLKTAIDFPQQLRRLEDEIGEEEDSDWADKELNFYTLGEPCWRDEIAHLKVCKYPEQVHADKPLLGGKQVQRAIELFRVLLIETLPDPFTLKNDVRNALGYLNSGLQHENWERCMVQVVSTMSKIFHILGSTT
jgi:hypothetical protein